MSDTAIVCEGLSKHFYIDAHAGIRSPLAAARLALRRALGRPQAAAEPAGLWALDDVSFRVSQGEVVGIIGPNGAGKSTLLRILSKITKPSRGEARVWGRVGSLLGWAPASTPSSRGARTST
jgi:lipopolysaccharide transport system ATP-binding protein